MTAVSTMIINSLIMTGEKSIGGTLTSNESEYYISRLNSMMDSWSNETLFIPYYSVTSFGLPASQGSYTIGVGGNFNMTRPIRIVDPCYIRDLDGNDTPLIILDEKAWGGIVDKNADGSYPCYMFYDSGYSATSTGTVYFWPEPSASLSTYINTLQPLQNLSTVTTNLQLPPGYQRAIETNFALEVAPGFISISPELAKIAKESKAAIKSTNATAPILRLDYGVSNTMNSNILTGP